MAPELIEQLATGPRDARLGQQDRALIDYVCRLTSDPASIERKDVGTLRNAGFDDRAIHDACQVAAYFAYVNRVANGLGVELEEGFHDPQDC